mgnify:CR=1 FL=1
MKRLLALILLFWALPASAGVVWTTQRFGTVSLYTATVTSAAGGGAAATINLHGKVLCIDTDPGATAPSDNWGCVLTNASGADALGAAISANRDTANSERTWPIVTIGALVTPVQAPVFGLHTLTCAAMGDSKVATVTLTVEEVP